MYKKDMLKKQSIIIGGKTFFLLTDDISQLKYQERLLQEAYLDIITSLNLCYPNREIDREIVFLLLLLRSNTINYLSKKEEGFGDSEKIEKILATIDSVLNT